MFGDDNYVERVQTYLVTVSFGGFIGCDIEYEVEAESEEEAEELALKMARDDLEIGTISILEPDEPEDDRED